MGCDIHVHIERNRTIDGKKKWYSVDHYKYNPYYEAFSEEGEQELEIVPIYDHRDYLLFATLCGVRNYYGVTPMDEPRGLPKDVSHVVAKESEEWGSDGHSHSWFTLKELLDYQISHPFRTYCGMVSPKDQYKVDHNLGTPNEWCQSTTLSGWAFRSWTEPGCALDYLIECIKERIWEDLYINPEWDDEEKLAEILNRECENFRIVFWFDN